ncbi:MAG: class I SAM-dependent methyltransferase [Gemmatimonadota bacterium]|jgi:SAM-dependent methyltransferase
MLGRTIDYWILRALAHDANKATEEELDTVVTPPEPGVVVEQALRRIEDLERIFEGDFPVEPGLRYLDIGCGSGDVAVALGRRGCTSVTGVDVVPRHVEESERLAEAAGVSDAVHFVCCDINEYDPTETFDVVMSFDAFEHIDDPRAALARMAELVAPDGVAVLGFGPLFYHPFGDHMWGFFHIQLPWRGAVFSERALLDVRREFFRPTDPAERLQDIVGGLNLMKYSEFLRYVDETGWTVESLHVNPGSKRFPPLFWASEALRRIPWVRDLVAGHIFTILRRR